MASKATPDEVINAGFAHESYDPYVTSRSEFKVFIQAILDDNVARVKDAVGASAYDDATKLTEIKLLERVLASAELLRRRSNIIKAQALPDGPTGREERLSAVEYEAEAGRIIERLRGHVGFAGSTESSSHFPQDAIT